MIITITFPAYYYNTALIIMRQKRKRIFVPLVRTNQVTYSPGNKEVPLQFLHKLQVHGN